MLITTQTTPADSDALSERLSDAFLEPFVIEVQELQVRASIGRAVFPADADSADSLLRRADASMFEAKRSALGAR